MIYKKLLKTACGAKQLLGGNYTIAELTEYHRMPIRRTPVLGPHYFPVSEDITWDVRMFKWSSVEQHPYDDFLSVAVYDEVVY